MSNTAENILATLAYFDMFDYPLTYNEVFSFLGNRYEPNEFKTAMDFLIANKLVFQLEAFYALKSDELIVIRRKKGNKKAEGLIDKAKSVGELLVKFPYVLGIGISGSLSKNFADENSDIDLFIITKKNRLWIARTIMHCFKKLTFLVNKQHYYCMNYYVDETQLEIVEKNIYTAIEVATLIPLQGATAFASFYAANSWINEYLPNKSLWTSSAKALKKHTFKIIVETLLNNNIGNRLEGILMNITAKRWNKKTQMKKLNLRGTIMGMSAGMHFAKPDPKNFQVKLIERYHSKLSPLLEQLEIKTKK